MSLGIYNRLWSLLGNACNELDLKLAESSQENITSHSTYTQYVGLIRRKSELQTEMDDKNNYIIVMTEMVTFASITLPDAEQSSMLEELRKDADDTHTSLNNMVISSELQ